MSEFYRSPQLRTATVLLLGGLGLISCGKDGEKPAPTTIVCAAENPSGWTAVPANFNVPKIADQLGVSEEQVSKGRFGQAMCEQAITPAEIEGGGTRIQVRDIGERCLAIGFQTEPINQPHQDVLAVCAADEAGA